MSGSNGRCSSASVIACSIDAWLWVIATVAMVSSIALIG
jgi:hypothetical protein